MNAREPANQVPRGDRPRGTASGTLVRGPAAREVKRAWVVFVVGALVLLALGTFSGCDHRFSSYDCGEPLAPVGVYSVTGDEAVTLYWIPADPDHEAGYVVYRSRTLNGAYVEIGHTSRDYFVDDGVRNGITYFYAVTSFNECDYESELSWEVAQDTPRPEGYEARLYDANGDDWRRSGWDFSTYRSLRWDAEETDILYLVEDGVAYLLAADLDTDIQDAGYTPFDEVGWAPERGWSPTGSVEVVEGHTYVVWTRDNHFAKVRVTHEGFDRITFDWAYQTDRGNPELKPRQRTAAGPVGPRALS